MVAELQPLPLLLEAAPRPRPWGLLATIGLSAGVIVVYGLIQDAIPAFFPALRQPENFGLAFSLPTLAAVPVGILLVLGLVRRRGLPVRDHLGLHLPTLAQGLGALAPLAAFNLV